MLIRGTSASGVGPALKRTGNEEGESDVKTFDIGHAGRARGIGRRHFSRRNDGRCSGRMSARSEWPITEGQSLVLSRRALERAALLVSGLRRPEGTLCVGADIAADSQARSAAFATSGDSRAGARSALLRTTGGG